jgi:plasmid stabilization system protein ParE
VTPEWSPAALADLNRFASFLEEHHPRLAPVIAAEIAQRIQLLAAHPQIGRPVKDHANYRELTLHVLNAPYVFQYRYHAQRLVILRVFHGREARNPIKE